MKKYYIGILALTAIVFGLTGYTIMQGDLAKKDKVLQEKAVDIAEKLNNYVDENGEVPASLKEAGVKSIPQGIRYTRESSEKYKFCVTYQTYSRGYSAGVTEVAMRSLYGRSGMYPNYSDSDYESSYLYIDSYGHDKGENCQTVKPDMYGSSSSDDFNYEEYCDPSYEYYEYMRDYCEEESGLDVQLD